MILIHSNVSKLFKKQDTNTVYCFANGHYQTVHPPSLTLIPPTHPYPLTPTQNNALPQNTRGHQAW